MIRKKYKKLEYNTEDLESLSNSDLKKVYLLNIIIDNLKSAVKTLEKLTNS